MEAVNPSLTGAVELWMGVAEGVIRRTLHKLAGQALAAYAVTQRSKWILEWPGQLVLNCSQVNPKCLRLPARFACDDLGVFSSEVTFLGHLL